MGGWGCGGAINGAPFYIWLWLEAECFLSITFIYAGLIHRKSQFTTHNMYKHHDWWHITSNCVQSSVMKVPFIAPQDQTNRSKSHIHTFCLCRSRWYNIGYILNTIFVFVRQDFINQNGLQHYIVLNTHKQYQGALSRYNNSCNDFLVTFFLHLPVNSRKMFV